MSDGVREVAVSYGMDASLPAITLYRAIRVRVETEREAMRLQALTMVNVAAFSRGAKMDYWDLVEHLYPDGVVKERRESQRIEQERRRQQEMLDRMMAGFGNGGMKNG